MTKTPDLSFSDYQPGGLAKLCAMQTEYYAREWGFNDKPQLYNSHNSRNCYFGIFIKRDQRKTRSHILTLPVQTKCQ